MAFFIFPYYKLHAAVAKIAYAVKKYNRVGYIIHSAKIIQCQGYLQGAFQIRIALLHGGGEDTAHGGLPRLVETPTGDNLECTPYLHGSFSL
jgi:hypothetical protein